MQGLRLRYPIRFIPAVLILCLCVVAPALAQTARQIAQRVFPSVVLLIIEDANGQALSQGNGFVVAKGMVATNFHVIEGGVSGVAKIVGSKSLHEISGVAGLDEKRELVLLSVPGVNVPALPLGEANRVAVGDRVYAVGNPLGLEGTFSEGIASDIRHVDGDVVFQITAPISPGSSEGPILNDQGQVIGVATALIEGSQNLNFAIPSSYVRSLLLSWGISFNNAKINNVPVSTLTVPLSTVSKRRDRGSIVTDLGKRSVEGVTVTHFSWGSHYCLGYLAYYSFSIRNRLRQPVKNLRLIVIFYDGDNEPVDIDTIRHKNQIPPRLAKRSGGSVVESTCEIVRSNKRRPSRVEIRVLDFELAG